jgi:hypothetical protein
VRPPIFQSDATTAQQGSFSRTFRNATERLDIPSSRPYGNERWLTESRQPVDLGWNAHLVRHEYILDTGAYEDFGLRDLLAADPNCRAELLLQAKHVD